MVVLVILGVMATGLTLGVQRIESARREADLERMRQWLEAASEQALFRGRLLVLRVDNRELQLDAIGLGLDGKPVSGKEGGGSIRHPIPEGWQVIRTGNRAPRWIISPDEMSFKLSFATQEGEISFESNSLGKVKVHAAERT